MKTNLETMPGSWPSMAGPDTASTSKPNRATSQVHAAPAGLTPLRSALTPLAFGPLAPASGGSTKEHVETHAFLPTPMPMPTPIMSPGPHLPSGAGLMPILTSAWVPQEAVAPDLSRQKDLPPLPGESGPPRFQHHDQMPQPWSAMPQRDYRPRSDVPAQSSLGGSAQPTNPNEQAPKPGSLLNLYLYGRREVPSWASPSRASSGTSKLDQAKDLTDSIVSLAGKYMKSALKRGVHKVAKKCEYQPTGNRQRGVDNADKGNVNPTNRTRRG